MLVLSRRQGEQIVVPECRLIVTVFDIRGERVKLGITAPPDVRVYRGELLSAVHASSTPQEAETPSASENSPTPVRVLIADPDEYLLDSYRDYLQQQGFDVATATTGVECVERLRECVPHVLVLEPSIPWGWGDGILARMHEEPDIPLVPVIVLTNGRDRGTLYRLAPFKIDDYQVKPVRPRRLAERVLAVANHRGCETNPPKHGTSSTTPRTRTG